MMIGEVMFAALLSACATLTNALTARNEKHNARKIIVVGSCLGWLPIRSRQERIIPLRVANAKTDMRVSDKRLVAKN